MELHYYNTWHQFVRASESETNINASQGPKQPRSMFGESRTSSRKADSQHGAQWSGTDTFEEAVELAKRGWPEGVKKIKENVHIIERFIAPKQPRKDLAFDVRGPGLVDFDRYFQGRPDPFVVTEEREDQAGQSVTIVPILFNISASCGVDVETMYRRGAAVCALIDILEHYKIRCEVKLVAKINNSGWRRRGQQGDDMHAFMCQVKKAEEPLDIDRMAFALCHAATFRRLMFSLMEEHIPDLSPGYGYPDVHREDGSINLDDSSLVIRREQDMVPWLKHQLQTYGIEVED